VIISLISIKQLIFITETGCGACKAGTKGMSAAKGSGLFEKPLIQTLNCGTFI
jgi:hypothetical protein